MRKAILFAASAALMVLGASCSKENTTVSLQENSPIDFGTYAGRNLITRAGEPGLMDDDLLQQEGFGVIAFHTDYSEGEGAYAKTSSLPNFMWNEHVTYSVGSWGYTPVKYWPNEHGDNADSGTNIDKLSFFAYAPYVAAGAAPSGITDITGNANAGDPKVGYKVADKPEDNVDLVWAVAPEDVTYVNADGDNVSIAKEMPYIDLSKPKTGMTINFLFKHATAKLGFQVLGVFDEGSQDSNTKITVKSVTFKGNYARTGILNLNNTAPGVALWESLTYDSGSESTLTVDKDNNLRASLTDGGDVDFATQPAGVSAVAQNLLADDVIFNLIPGSISEVEIDYFVTTDDSKLAKTYSRVENKIKYTFDTPLSLQNNKAYTINMQLGMTTVKMSATVAGWGGDNATTIDLPKNAD